MIDSPEIPEAENRLQSVFSCLLIYIDRLVKFSADLHAPRRWGNTFSIDNYNVSRTFSILLLLKSLREAVYRTKQSGVGGIVLSSNEEQKVIAFHSVLRIGEAFKVFPEVCQI
jgi:hypothetical protein